MNTNRRKFIQNAGLSAAALGIGNTDPRFTEPG